MKIHMPNSAFLGNINPFIKSFDPQNAQILEITANKKWISVHPVVICMIATLGLKTEPQNIFCEKFEATSKHYFERMGLFKMLGITFEMSIKEHEPAGRFIPLTQIQNSQQQTDFIKDMVPLLHLSPNQSESIKFVIAELVRNVLEHSGSKQGALICAQFYPKSNCVRIGIVDTGCGIKKTINLSHRADSHLEAIQLALTPGITGTTRKDGGTEANAGAGLFFIKSIAAVNRDFFLVYSGEALYKLKTRKPDEKIKLFADPLRDRCSKEENLPYWQGTVVGIDISLQQTQELSLLLEHISKIYRQTIRERKKQKYKKARFI